jgi:hypothetical protein
MNTKDIEDMRHEILKDIEEKFTQELVPALLTEKDDYGVEVLGVVLEGGAADGYDASGEFFFLPGSEDDEVQYFVNLITLAEKLPEENLPELEAAVACINTYVLTGAFAIDVGAGSLVYKHTYEMPAGISKETVEDNVDLSMGTALNVVDNFGYLLIEVNEGKRKAESVVNFFLGGDN